MFTAQIPCSITEHAISAAKDGKGYSVRQTDRHIRAADATHRYFPIKGKTCKPLRHVTRAGEERLREASKLFVEGASHAEIWLPSGQRFCHRQGLCATTSLGRLDAGLKEGIDEDELLARQIGLSDASQLSTTQEKYKERIKEKLLEVCTSCSTCHVCSKFCHQAPDLVNSMSCVLNERFTLFCKAYTTTQCHSCSSQCSKQQRLRQRGRSGIESSPLASTPTGRGSTSRPCSSSQPPWTGKGPSVPWEARSSSGWRLHIRSRLYSCCASQSASCGAVRID